MERMERYYEWVFQINGKEWRVISDSEKSNALAELALAVIFGLERTTKAYRIKKIMALKPVFISRVLTDKEPVDIGKL